MTTFAGHAATAKGLSNGDLRQLRVHRRAGLFRVLAGDERERLRASMTNGYDEAHPIVVWKETGEIVDGRNRRDLAVELQLRDVPVALVDFPDETAVTAYVVQQNLARRHLTPKEQAEMAGALVNGGMSTRRAAQATGVSKDTAQRAAAAARSSGVSDETPARRTTGADGKSYPATKPPSSRQTGAVFTTLGITGHLEQATEELSELSGDASLTPSAMKTITHAHEAWLAAYEFALQLLGDDGE